MPTTTTPAPRRRLPRAERAEQLLDVAEAVFAEYGVQAASMDEIAARAGVSKPVLYDHFASKQGLVDASITRARAELLRRTEAAVTGVEDPRGALRAGLGAFFSFVAENRASWSAVLAESAPGTETGAGVAASRREQAAFTATLLAAANPEADALTVGVAAQTVTGACERLSLWWEEHPTVTVDGMAERLTAILWPGLSSL